MKLIYGEHSSGKSTKALNLIKDKRNVLYVSLDQDKSVANLFSKGLKNTEYQYIQNCFLIDLEFSIIGSDGGSSAGKLIYDTIVLDSLNFIKVVQDKSECNLKQIIKGLEYLHYTYGVEIIATYNILRNVDKMKWDVESLFVSRPEWELIETISKPTKSKADEFLERKAAVPENFW